MHYFIVFYVAVVFGCFYFFLKTKSLITRHHSQNILSLEQKISLHKTQIKFRKKSLHKYNFQIYNLDDSLQVQPEIKLN